MFESDKAMGERPTDRPKAVDSGWLLHEASLGRHTFLELLRDLVHGEVCRA